MDFLDVAFLLSRASITTTFLKNCGRGESLGTTTCLTTVAGEKHGHAACKVVIEVEVLGPPHVSQLWLEKSKGMLPVSHFRSNKASFCVS